MKTLIQGVFLIAALSATGVAADKPNFSGEWKLDAGKSNLGPIPPPSSMTRKVEHSEPVLTVVEAMTGGPMGDQNRTTKYSTDGKETTNDLMGNPVKTSAAWEGDTLVISAKADIQGTAIKLTDKWSLSGDGKVLTDVMHIATDQGDFDVTYVLNKQ